MASDHIDFDKLVENVANNLDEINASIELHNERKKEIQVQLAKVNKCLKVLDSLDSNVEPNPQKLSHSKAPLSTEECLAIMERAGVKLPSSAEAKKMMEQKPVSNLSRMHSVSQTVHRPNSQTPQMQKHSSCAEFTNQGSIEEFKIKDYIKSFEEMQEQLSQIKINKLDLPRKQQHYAENVDEEMESLLQLLAKSNKQMEEKVGVTSGYENLNEKTKEVGIRLQKLSEMVNDFICIVNGTKEPKAIKNMDWDLLLTKEFDELKKLILECFHE